MNLESRVWFSCIPIYFCFHFVEVFHWLSKFTDPQTQFLFPNVFFFSLSFFIFWDKLLPGVNWYGQTVPGSQLIVGLSPGPITGSILCTVGSLHGVRHWLLIVHSRTLQNVQAAGLQIDLCIDLIKVQNSAIVALPGAFTTWWISNHWGYKHPTCAIPGETYAKSVLHIY